MNVDKTKNDGTDDAQTENDNDDVDFLLYCIISKIEKENQELSTDFVNWHHFRINSWFLARGYKGYSILISVKKKEKIVEFRA